MNHLAGLERAAGRCGPPVLRPRGARRGRPCGIVPGWQDPHPLPVAVCPPAKRVGAATPTSKEGTMSVLQSLRQGGKSALRPFPILGSLLLALTFSPPARAVTYVSIDGHPAPITLVAGETITLRFDVATPGGPVNVRLSRDLTGTGKYDPAAPLFVLTSFADGSGQDTDPTPGKLAVPYYVRPDRAAGPYVLELDDTAGTVVLPGVTIVPQPQPQ